MRSLSMSIALLGLTIGGAAVPPAHAQDLPEVFGELSVEIQNDNVYDSDDPAAEINDLYTTTEAIVGVAFSERFAIVSHAVLEPVVDAVDDRAFEDHGLYVEEIYARWTGVRWRLVAGKFDPGFGVGWDLAPGIYGTDFAEDYEIAEQWGAGVSVDVADGGAAGTVTLGANVFMADRTVLSRSLLEDRGPLRYDDGGPGNTRWPKSFTLTVDGAEVPTLPGFGYHAGLLYRPGGAGDPGDERGAVLGVTQALDLGGGHGLELLVEGALFGDVGASRDDAAILTAGAAWTYGGSDVSDELFQVSAGYAFESGLGVDVGWRHGDEGGVRSRTLGALLSYSLEF